MPAGHRRRVSQVDRFPRRDDPVSQTLPHQRWGVRDRACQRSDLLEFHKAFGFKDFGEARGFAKPLSFGTIAKSQLPRALYLVLSPNIRLAQWPLAASASVDPRKTSSGVSVEPIRRFDESAQGASAGIAKHHKYHAGRDAALLNARFFSLTCRDYHVFTITSDGAMIGYVALRVMDMKGFRSVDYRRYRSRCSSGGTSPAAFSVQSTGSQSSSTPISCRFFPTVRR